MYYQNDKKATNRWGQWGDGSWRFVDGSGKVAVSRWITYEGNRYYVGADGRRYENEWFSIDSVPKNPLAAITTSWYYAGADGMILKDGWHNINGKNYYFYGGGNSPKKTFLNLDGYRYYVDETGARQENGWFSLSGINSKGAPYTNWYYAVPGGALLCGGWAELNGNYYYFDKNGNSPRKNWVNVEDNRYYVNEEGIRQHGWFTINGVNSNGQSYENLYFATPEGVLFRGGWADFDGNRYYFDANGTMYKKRWLTTEKGGKQYFGPDESMYRNCWFGIDGTRADGTTYTNWYYAGENGTVHKNGWITVDGKEYYLKSGGNMATGWLDDEKYYLGEDGAKLHGWQQIEIDDDWISDNENVADHVAKYGKTGWFYFSSESGKKKEASSGACENIKIDGITYGFDTYGILQQGWVRVKGMSPALKGYRYYYPDQGSDSFRLGQLVSGAWLKTGLPDKIDGPNREEWHYFLPTGEPVCAAAGKYVVKEIDGKEYAFDMYGNARYGLIEINGEFFYFGAEDGDRSKVSGKCTIVEDWSGEAAEYCFTGAGKGVTGIEDGYFYYKGKLQKANKYTKYEVFNVPGKGHRLINSSGKVVKGRKVTDGDGCKWTVSSSGAITQYGSDEEAELEAPEAVEYAQ